MQKQRAELRAEAYPQNWSRARLYILCLCHNVFVCREKKLNRWNRKLLSIIAGVWKWSACLQRDLYEGEAHIILFGWSHGNFKILLNFSIKIINGILHWGGFVRYLLKKFQKTQLQLSCYNFPCLCTLSLTIPSFFDPRHHTQFIWATFLCILSNTT